VSYIAKTEVYKDELVQNTAFRMICEINGKLNMLTFLIFILWFLVATGYRLCRGYKLDATETDRPVDVTHLVFVIHGIGQKMDTGRIIRNTSTYV
jgi:cellobiose-specific phosphotransferase system component IIC